VRWRAERLEVLAFANVSTSFRTTNFVPLADNLGSILFVDAARGLACSLRAAAALR